MWNPPGSTRFNSKIFATVQNSALSGFQNANVPDVNRTFPKIYMDS